MATKRTRYQIARSKASKFCKTGSANDKKGMEDAIKRYEEDAVKKGKTPSEAKTISGKLRKCNFVGAAKKTTKKKTTTTKRKTTKRK